MKIKFIIKILQISTICVIGKLVYNNVKANDLSETKNSCLIDACKCGDFEVVKDLVEDGADIHTENDKALVEACTNKHFEIAKYLISKGISPSSNNYYYIETAPKEYIVELLD